MTDEEYTRRIMEGYAALDEDEDDEDEGGDEDEDGGYVYTTEVCLIPYDVFVEFVIADGDINGWLV